MKLFQVKKICWLNQSRFCGLFLTASDKWRCQYTILCDLIPSLTYRNFAWQLCGQVALIVQSGHSKIDLRLGWEKDARIGEILQFSCDVFLSSHFDKKKKISLKGWLFYKIKKIKRKKWLEGNVLRHHPYIHACP